jgi:hypothetical protein
VRYRELIKKAECDGISLREMARSMGLPVASLHQYKDWPTEPRLEALRKMSLYFGEPISVLISEDSDLTAHLITAIRRLSLVEQEKLLKALQKKGGPHSVHIKKADKNKGSANQD